MHLLSMTIFYRLITINDIIVISDIFKSRNIKSGVIYHCHERNVLLVMQKIFNYNKISIAAKYIDRNFHNDNDYRSKLGVVLDSACDNWEVVLDSVSNITISFPVTWIIKTDDSNSLLHKLSNHPLEIYSDFIILHKERNSKVYVVKEVYNTGFYTKGSLVVNVLGNSMPKRYSFKLRTNLKGVVLKCPIVILDPIVRGTYLHFLDTISPPHVDPVHKFKFYIVLKYLEEMYNFRLDFERTNSWGYLRNGTFDGMVGALQHQLADVGGSAVFFRTDRMKYVNYVAEIWKTRPCFIFRHPKFPGGFYTIYTRPLSATVWRCLIAILMLAGLLLCAMLKLKSRIHDDADASFSLIFVFITSAVGQQGIPIYNSSSSIKVLIFSTLIFTLTVYQYYNATVVSTLLHQPPRSIKTLKDLLNSKLQVGIEDSLYDKDYFKRTTDPVALELFRKKVVTGTKINFFKADYGMALVKRGGFAFHLDVLTGYRAMRSTFSEREICDAFEIQLYPPQHTGLVLKKGSPYREIFAVGIRKMFEAGIMSRLRSVWDEPRPQCVRTPDSSIFSVNIREFSMALVILALGMVFAFIVLFMEVLVFKMNIKHIPYYN